jgi:hypothetical protein
VVVVVVAVVTVDVEAARSAAVVADKIDDGVVVR